MYKSIIALFATSRILIIIFALVAPLVLPLNLKSWLGHWFDPTIPYFYWIWANFDGINYLHIARGNYGYPYFAYFPFFPLLISALHYFLPFLTKLHAGVLVANSALFASLFVLYKITLLDYKKHIAISAIVFLLFIPTSFFYSAVYADSLYLLLSLLSFYNARKSRWLIAGIFGFAASLTRLIGVILLPVLLLEWYLQQKSQFSLKKFVGDRVWFLFLIPFGLIAYSLFLQIFHGDFLAFQKSMSAWNQGQFVFPLQVIFRYIKILLSVPFGHLFFVAVIELLATFFYFGLSIYVLRKIRFSYGIFMMITLLIPTFTGTLQSMPRYILHLFPAFIALSVITQRSKILFWGTIVAFVILQFIFVSLFTRGFFIS